MDTYVRDKAVSWIADMYDSDLSKYLLQLIQCLKYENHYNSRLQAFLIKRVLRNPYQIGHYLFWALKSEFHGLKHCERFGVIMEEYHPNTIKPTLECEKIIVDRCRFMDSAKVPLWLELKNSDPFAKAITVLFKSGDDLRQDMLTIQILEIMLQHKIDLHLKPYRVLSTGVNANNESVGMLEIVLPSVTVKDINKTYGTFAKESIDMYIVKHNPGTDDLIKARENFTCSCAGYCVATGVLGIGDRHPSNVLVTDRGHFFYINFGHFLVPLLFNPAMKYYIDQASKYDNFLDCVAEAFLVLRQESRLLLVLFTLTVPASMLELMHEKDIDYFKNMLLLDSDRDGATEGIHAFVAAGRRDVRRLFDHWFHQQDVEIIVKKKQQNDKINYNWAKKQNTLEASVKYLQLNVFDFTPSLLAPHNHYFSIVR
ncbi:Phosphatidylinositol 3- and 4-kinase family protein [Reticulomyxa filosa]|uniref:Phosphatidylinositol 3-and 4-kinase family protein n=1 Tax=Reticulomyxa filosa TaxID=46433 RepID=X6LZI2_RETFI|nr:Phosphatidylinositol 3- and 4-kinase family protein [Reticulomyxa filosa]|eukprot:ETO06145.1 Phosphatidylinositol 3- and 4-kinase family protein [Reticulomyxa filosa]